MDIKEANTTLDNTMAALLKPTTAITQTISSKHLKIARLTEYCKIAEDQLKKFESEVQMLTSSKRESEKLKAEYINRNKINSTNTDSLVQVKNELYKYKCELKSNYITTQRAIRSRKQRYQKLISSYESDWQKTLEKYNSNPIVLELVEIQEENISLEKEVEKLEKLKSVTEAEFVEVTQKVKQKFLNEVVEFSKAMAEYNKVLDLRKKKKEMVQEKSSAFNFGRTEIPVLNIKGVLKVEDNGDQMCLSGIDVSVFDDVSIPAENLEAQNEEELLPFFENESKPNQNSDDKYQTEEMEVDPKDNQEQEECKNMQQQTKMAIEGESQYFRSQHQTENGESEVWIKSQGMFVKSGNKEFNENQQIGKLKGNGGEEEFQREMQTAKETFRMENEESLSDGSFENQYGFQNKPLENKQMAPREYNENVEAYTKTPSVSSDDMSHHGNEGAESPENPEKPNGNFLLKSEPEKDFKSFGGFFNIGSETNSPKPSIFKLF